MAQMSGKYQYVKDNFTDFLRKKGVPADKIESYKPPKSLDIEVEGEKYTITKTLEKNKSVMKYVLGEIVEEHWPGIIVKSVPKFVNNVLIIESTDDKGITRSRNYAFGDDGVEMILKSPDGLEGKIFFERI